MALAKQSIFDSPQAPEFAPQYALEVSDLSKKFVRRSQGKNSYSTLKSWFLGIRNRTSNQATYTEAISDLTLRIPKGKSVGLIGRNGSGKSTFLKLITGIYKPDRGTVTINGRVAALIELSAGFHPDFTGRENLYLSGALYGLSRKEVNSRIPAIVEFAELQDFIDDPVRTYSSGMFMRLAFSLAIHTDPDILLVDEILSVGDAAFVTRCKEKISALRRAGKTLILVSHDLEAVERWCDEVLWLNKGRVIERGDARRVIDAYLSSIEEGEEAELSRTSERSLKPEEAKELSRWGGREAEITKVRLVNAQGDDHQLFHSGDRMLIEVSYVLHKQIKDPVFGVAIWRNDGLLVHGTNTNIEEISTARISSRGIVRYDISFLDLLEGSYTLDVACHREDGYPYDYHKGVCSFLVRSKHKAVGVVNPPHSWSFE